MLHLKKINKNFVVVMMCLLLTGCGGEYIGENRTVPSDNTVSGSAVSGSVVSENALKYDTASEGAGRYTYCTDTNLYRLDGEHILQSRLDGTCEKKLNLWNVEMLDYVSGHWLYYEKLMGKEDKNGIPMTAVYRAPIYRDGDGYDIVAEEEAEVVVSGINVKAYVYADDEYILYEKADEGTFIKYDIEKKREMTNEVKIKGAVPGICVRVGDTFVMRDYDEDRLYAQKKEELSWNPIADVNLTWQPTAWDDRAFYYAEGKEDETGTDYSESVRQYVAETEEDGAFVSKEELYQTAAQALSLTEKDEMEFCYCYLDGLFCQSGRLYIQVEASWISGDIYYMRYMIFSKGQDGAPLRYEKALTETMWQKGCECREEKVNANDAQCLGMIEGRAYLSLYDYEKEKAGFGCVELDSTEFCWLDSEDAKAFALEYDEQTINSNRPKGWSPGDRESVMENDREKNACIGFYYVSDSVQSWSR